MSEPLFTQIINQVAPLTEEVCFHLMGEPLVHSQFSRFVQICEDKKLPVNITSNGALLNLEREQALLNSTIRQVNFSLHSFEANFPEKDIQIYLDKILKFTHRALTERPDLYINYRLWSVGDKIKDQSMSLHTQKILQSLDSEFGFKLSHQVDVKWKKSVKVKNRLYLHFDSRFRWPSTKDPVRSTEGTCHGLTQHIGILADGRVVPCCLDKEGVLTLGQCGTDTSVSQSVGEILETEKVKNMIQGFQKFKLVEDLCQKCTFISRFKPKQYEPVSRHHGR